MSNQCQTNGVPEFRVRVGVEETINTEEQCGETYRSRIDHARQYRWETFHFGLIVP